ncbi:MAG TPA: phosphate propanoyltransferase [Acidobacteriota bacterium]|nr:phosphate propanoyltransferase [Acidobacteriota bacterium]
MMPLSLSRPAVEEVVRSVVASRLSGGWTTCQSCPRITSSPLVVNVSARHMHVSQADLEVLFGLGYQLTPLRPLYQEGHFAAQETVTLIGPRSRLISNLRILGPCRKQSQIELAFTDAIALGIDDVPIRLSGDITGTPGAYVMGPKGVLHLKEGVIRAAMHVHMSVADAEAYGVVHRDIMKLRVGGEAGVVFTRVHVRVDPAYKLEVHMDTDEANACGLRFTRDVQLFK